MKKITIFLSVAVFSLLSLSLAAKDKLVCSVLLTRHGDRTPFSSIKNTHYKWDTKLEQLTPVGMKQEFKLGQKLRKYYIEDVNFLKSKYQPETIYTISSGTNRTIMSAQCLLTGLYPPGTGPALKNGTPALPNKMQIIPVRTIPKKSDLIMKPYPQYLKILSKYIYPSKKWREKQSQYKAKFKEWTKILGNKIESLADVLSIGDILIVAKTHHKPLPKGLSKKDAQTIINLTKWGRAEQFKSRKVSYLMGNKLLNKITKQLNKVPEGKQPYKLIYYSGHDLTLLSIMSLMGAPLDIAPGYASNIQIGLFKKNTEYIIKVKYNFNNVELPIMSGKSFCTLEDFNKHVETINNKYKRLLK